MHKITLAAIVAVALTAPAFAMEIKDYPRTAAEVEYCVKARLDKDIEVPDGCRTLGERILMGISHALKN